MSFIDFILPPSLGFREVFVKTEPSYTFLPEDCSCLFIFKENVDIYLPDTLHDGFYFTALVSLNKALTFNSQVFSGFISFVKVNNYFLPFYSYNLNSLNSYLLSKMPANTDSVQEGTNLYATSTRVIETINYLKNGNGLPSSDYIIENNNLYFDNPSFSSLLLNKPIYVQILSVISEYNNYLSSFQNIQSFLTDSLHPSNLSNTSLGNLLSFIDSLLPKSL